LLSDQASHGNVCRATGTLAILKMMQIASHLSQADEAICVPAHAICAIAAAPHAWRRVTPDESAVGPPPHGAHRAPDERDAHQCGATKPGLRVRCRNGMAIARHLHLPLDFKRS
jgi:hypothetical protein